MNNHHQHKVHIRKPRWLKKPLPSGSDYENLRALISSSNVHTVCQEAKCPNIWECFSQKSATFLIMGDRCTRNCRFCAIAHGPAGPPDPGEPVRVAEAAQKMGLKYVVITSVTRDDLPDGGAELFAETVMQIHKRIPDARAEVLVPDFGGNWEALMTVVGAHPAVINHNLETVPRLYPLVRPQAVYGRSLELLKQSRLYDSTITLKSGLMLGLGETQAEIEKTLRDLLDAGSRILTLGQYLQPTKDQLQVDRFIHPEEFDNWRETALKMGFSGVTSGPLVRSSFHAKELYKETMQKIKGL
jgi:lipoic acid synthetase